MSTEDELKLFEEEHPHPDQIGLTSLFCFSRADQPDHLRLLFVEGKLYHPLPCQLNDPFECKPHFRWPEKAKEVKAIRKHLIKLIRKKGISRKKEEERVTQVMRKEVAGSAIYDAVIRNLGKVRICSFTSSMENLLFWAHYADSHRGFCVEYDAKVLPIAYAFKVRYSNKYPEAKYPIPEDRRTLKPVLIKSEEWKHEKEFRTILVPEATHQPENDGISLILDKSSIKNVYFGALMQDCPKKQILQLLEEGPFSPGIWQATLAPSEFRLQFHELP